jgi:hypothetical protein
MSAQSVGVVPFNAVVQAPDGVLFEAGADSEHELLRQLAQYVRDRSANTLWPDDARRVWGLLERGKPQAAITLYFDCVGDRWDDEWLEISLSDSRF